MRSRRGLYILRELKLKPLSSQGLLGETNQFHNRVTAVDSCNQVEVSHNPATWAIERKLYERLFFQQLS